MIEILAMPETTAFLERRFDLRICFVDLLTRKELDRLDEVSSGVERRVDLESVLDAGMVVVGAVTWSRVDHAGSGFQRHVGAKHAERVARIERVTKRQPLHRLAVEGREQPIERASRLRGNGLGQILRDDDRGTVDVIGAVSEVGMERDPQV